MSIVKSFLNYKYTHFVDVDNTHLSQLMNTVMKQFFILFFALAILSQLNAQSDPVLLKIEDQDIRLSEFSYIYEKNNRENADYSKESLNEYLDLYINFKLKVQRAKELGYHQQDSYKEELEGYRRQLADSYVVEREVVDALVEESYQRKTKDIGIRHILIAVNRNGTSAQKKDALERCLLVQEEIQAGMSFETAAREYSEDKNSSNIGGDIGYITGGLPDGYLGLEDAAYSMKVGDISGPIYTDLGYHLIKLTDIRPARGTIEASHILIKKKLNGMIMTNAEERINQIYAALVADSISFEDGVYLYSEDIQSKGAKGRLGFFGISQYEKSFEDAAFSIDKDGGISKPVETSIGWHIIKRISKRPAADKAAIREKVKTDELSLRYQLMKRKVTDRIKKEANYQESPEALQIFKDSLDLTFYEYDWEKPLYPKLPFAKFDNKDLTLSDLADFANAQTRTRMRAKGQLTLSDLADEIVMAFGTEKALAYAESKLEERYPDFRNLMREYEEGILLFEVTKDHVWDKAAKDTIGLKQFFNENKARYQWLDRAKLTTYSIRSIDPSVVSSILRMARYSTPEEVKEAYNKDNELVVAETDVFEKGSDFLAGLSWDIDVAAPPNFNNSLKVTTFKKIEEIYPPQPKEFKEAKGYIISDFQESLEKEWIKELRKKYKYSIDKKTLKSITKG